MLELFPREKPCLHVIHLLIRLCGAKSCWCSVYKRCRHETDSRRIVFQPFTTMVWFVRVEAALPSGVIFFTSCLLLFLNVTTLWERTCLLVEQRGSRTEPRKCPVWQCNSQRWEHFTLLWQWEMWVTHHLARSVGLQVSARMSTRLTRHPPRRGLRHLALEERWEAVTE